MFEEILNAIDGVFVWKWKFEDLDHVREYVIKKDCVENDNLETKVELNGVLKQINHIIANGHIFV